MGKYYNSGIGKGIGTSSQTSLENQVYENKVKEIEEKVKTNTIVKPKAKMSEKGKRLLNSATNEKLKNVIKELYRPGASIDDGGTADAIRHEIETGELVGGKSHIQKGIERLKNLENILNRFELNENDKKIAQELYDDLKDALGGKKNDK